MSLWALQGTPGRRDARNPTLVPNFDIPVANGSTIDLESPALFLQNNPRANASATATIGGSVTTGDEITLEVSNTVFANKDRVGAVNPVTVTYTTVGGDTVTTIAENLADLLNKTPEFQQFGLLATVVGAVITVLHGGPVGNYSVLSANLEPDTITITGTATNLDTLNVLFTGAFAPAGHLVTVAVATSETTTQMATAVKNAINADATLIAASITATSGTNVVTLAIPAADEPVTVVAYANPATQTATVGGTITAGDVLGITVTANGTAVALSHTVLLAETTDTIAVAFAALVNGNATLAGAGVTATEATSVLTFHWPAATSVIFSKSVPSAASETITLTGNATETMTYAASATETVTFSPSNGVMSGGSGPIIPVNNFNYSLGSNLQSFFYGRPVNIGSNVISALVRDGMPIV